MYSFFYFEQVCCSMSSSISQSLLKFMSIDLVMLFKHLILCCPLILFPWIFPSTIFPRCQLFTSVVQDIVISSLALVLPMNIQCWYPLGFDWFELLAVQRTLRSVLQHHNLKASILQCSAFFMIHFLHPHMNTRKTVAFTPIQTFACKVMSLLFNALSRFVIAFLSRSNCLWLSWLQSLSVVILESKKIKSVTISTFSLSMWDEKMGLNAMSLVFWMLSFKPAFLKIIFNWMIIALQHCVGFYQTWTCIHHRLTHVPSHLNIHPISLPFPPF